jgi:hypothetical protein
VLGFTFYKDKGKDGEGFSPSPFFCILKKVCGGPENEWFCRKTFIFKITWDFGHLTWDYLKKRGYFEINVG